MRRFLLPLVFGFSGFAMLCALGVWQLQRLAWKEGILSQISETISAAPTELPAQPSIEADLYKAVAVQGRFSGPTIRVLVSHRSYGAGYRLITGFETQGRKILLDRGFVSVSKPQPQTPNGDVAVIGNLHWPQEIDDFTPPNDIDANLWFSRDVDALAAALKTEPVLLIASQITPHERDMIPLPVDTSTIPNDHLGYAIQWFGFAAVWLAMTILALYKTAKRQKN